jgi:hypothetical protein
MKKLALLAALVAVLGYFVYRQQQTITGLQAAAQQDQTAASNTPSSAPEQTAVATSSHAQGLTAADRNKIVSLLTQTTDGYTGVYSIGRKALGTTQYADGFAGTQALTDPSSSASQFSAFHRVWLKGDMFNGMMAAYSQASSIYTNDNAPEDALDKWRDDMNTLDADIGIWAGTAVDCQVKGTSTQALQSAEQKIRGDFNRVESDIAAVKNNN